MMPFALVFIVAGIVVAMMGVKSMIVAIPLVFIVAGVLWAALLFWATDGGKAK